MPKSRVLAHAVAAALLPALAAPAYAAETASILEEVVVSAQKREQNIQDVGISIQAFTGDQLEALGVTSSFDVAAFTPGVHIGGALAGQNSQFTIRGVTQNDFNDIVEAPNAVYLDEGYIPIANGQTFGVFDIERVEVLKGPQGTLFGRNSTGGAVLLTTAKPTNEFEGSASVRVGNYDLRQVQGMLNLPISDDKVLLRLAANFEESDGFQKNLFSGTTNGDVDRKNARVSLTLKGERVRNELVIDYAKSGGNNVGSVVYNVLAPGQGTPFVPTNVLYTPTLDAVFGPGSWAAYLAANPKVDPDGLVAFTAKQQARGPFVIDTDGLNFHESKDWIVSNVTTFDIGDDLQLKNIIGYVDRETFDSSEFDGTPYGIDSNGGRGRGGPLTAFSEELQILGETGALNYVAGVYYADEKIDTYSLSLIVELLPFIPVTSQVNEGETKSKTYAGYAQGTYDLAGATGVEGLSATLGARYSSEKVSFDRSAQDQYSVSPNPAYVDPLKDTFEKFSWTAGLNWQMNDDVLLYAVSRRSFRSGGFNFFAPPLPGFGNAGGAEYDAETATDVELGLKFKGTVGGVPTRLNVAAYTMWVKNIQRSNYVQIFGALAGITVNVPKAKIPGLELDGVVSPTDWLDLGWSVNYTDAKFTDNLVSVLGNPAAEFGPYPDAPEWSGNAYAAVNVPVASTLRLSLRGDVYAQSASWFSSTGSTLNPGSEIPGYGTANFQVGIEDVDAGWSLTANVKNAFDKTYYVGGIGFASLFAVNTVIPGAPRTYSVEAKYRF